VGKRVVSRLVRSVVAVSATALAVAPVAAAATPRVPAGSVPVSDERSRTVPAAVLRPTIVRAHPDDRARHRGRLTPYTFHGSREVVVVLARSRDDGGLWSYVRYSGLGVRKGWVPSDALHRRESVRTRLIVDRRRLRVTLRRAGRVVMSVPAGVGARGSPTPAGRYFVRERVALAGGVFGARAFGLSAYSPFRTDWPGGGQVGVHGTNAPAILPGRVSNGCVRLRDADVIRLARRLPVGTPVEVR
jgi:hypothetical protein